MGDGWVVVKRQKSGFGFCWRAHSTWKTPPAKHPWQRTLPGLDLGGSGGMHSAPPFNIFVPLQFLPPRHMPYLPHPTSTSALAPLLCVAFLATFLWLMSLVWMDNWFFIGQIYYFQQKEERKISQYTFPVRDKSRIIPSKSSFLSKKTNHECIDYYPSSSFCQKSAESKLGYSNQLSR